MDAHDSQQGDKRAYESAGHDLGHPDDGQEMRDCANKDHEQVSKRQCLMGLDSQPENCHTTTSQDPAQISQARSSPGPSIADLKADEKLRDMAEWIPRFMLDDFYKEHRLFLYSPDYDRIIQRDSRFPMNRGIVPSNPSTMLEVMTPTPDIVYGYSLSNSFSLAQWNKLNTIPGAEVANELCLIFPLLVVEFKGFDESLAVAASECLGSSAACVNSADSLNRYLQEVRELNPLCSIADIETCAYSLTMTGWVAVLYVTWKELDGSFKMQRFGTYLLQKPEEFLELRKRLKNILDWGRGARLTQISGLLDWLVQEEQNAQALTAPSPAAATDIVMASTPPSCDWPDNTSRKPSRPIALLTTHKIKSVGVFTQMPTAIVLVLPPLTPSPVWEAECERLWL
ncbi:hypothetical protein F503_00455 [Ophiostoma piceae UAMH 11346]|uniref:DUF7924 domain-containing protein n=1 Tax=Ophiostoma piceae (strain UAMH 11346) TaxID=1262450 RepID=S3CML0_OPHP1|nr:hypothetical protein F503_00455 [Ophiostoma piceae UAMH 11346]